MLSDLFNSYPFKYKLFSACIVLYSALQSSLYIIQL